MYVELVTRGYTVSAEKDAALGRIGDRYVMRDRKGHLIGLPLATKSDHLREVWTAFLQAAVSSEPMPAVLCGETVASRSPGRQTKSAIVSANDNQRPICAARP
jgi:hypothetical protein